MRDMLLQRDDELQNALANYRSPRDDAGLLWYNIVRGVAEAVASGKVIHMTHPFHGHETFCGVKMDFAKETHVSYFGATTCPACIEKARMECPHWDVPELDNECWEAIGREIGAQVIAARSGTTSTRFKVP